MRTPDNTLEMKVNDMKKILVTGSAGQIGSELVLELRERYGKESVIAGWHSKKPEGALLDGPHARFDTSDTAAFASVIKGQDVGAVYHLVSLLSAAGEKNPELAWKVNMDGLRNVFDLANEHRLRVFWPSSIAVFGPTTPKRETPQATVLEPSTMYGVTKVAGELLAAYYHSRHGVDVRSLRYPGLISWKTPPGGGTTDYAIDIFHQALLVGRYTSFLAPDTMLPMMYMDDAIRATVELMEAPAERLSTRAGYNLAAMFFTPSQLAEEIRKDIPGFTIRYEPDFRQAIADSWPDSIDDSVARRDWDWQHRYDIRRLTTEMLRNLPRVLAPARMAS